MCRCMPTGFSLSAWKYRNKSWSRRMLRVLSASNAIHPHLDTWISVRVSLLVTDMRYRFTGYIAEFGQHCVWLLRKGVTTQHANVAVRCPLEILSRQQLGWVFYQKCNISHGGDKETVRVTRNFVDTQIICSYFQKKIIHLLGFLKTSGRNFNSFENISPKKGSKEQ